MSKPTTKSLDLHYAGGTDVGPRRKNNEDAWWAGPLAKEKIAPLETQSGTLSLGGHGALLGVSDGLGGANAGEIASRLALSELHASLAEDENLEPSVAAAIAALQQSNDAIVRAARSNPEWAGMGATVSFLWVHEHGAVLGQVGDSRIYRLREGWLDELSVDHSPVGRLRQSGRLSEVDARRHPGRHVIDQCLGGGDPGVAPDCEPVDMQADDVMLLCSDGLTDGVPDAEIAGVLGAVAAGEMTLEESVTELIKRANHLSGADNVTIIVARCVAK